MAIVLIYTLIDGNVSLAFEVKKMYNVFWKVIFILSFPIFFKK